jgi:sensor domain CHASE-containing protein
MTKHPFIPIFCLLVFGFLCGSGIAIIKVVAYQEEQEIRDEALALAKDTGAWFSNQLDQAILPLFSMAQFVVELPIFHGLASQIGPAFDPGSAPFNPPNDDGIVTHRNVTGICDDPLLFDRFSTIASNIKKQAKMEGVLVNLQLAPHSVVCLVNPINNTEDFQEGIFMDNSEAIGHDLLTDPARKFIAEATIPSDKVVIAGPLTLRQCAPTCKTSVEQGFIARLPIEMPDHHIIVDGVSYNRWGFAVAIINWKALVERSSIYANFEKENLVFHLTRTDKTYNPETGSFTEKVVILAETPIGDSTTRSSVKTALQTTNNEWEMNVYYKNSEAAINTAMAACVLIAFGISVLVYTILVQKQLHADAFAEQPLKDNTTVSHGSENRTRTQRLHCS